MPTPGQRPAVGPSTQLRNPAIDLTSDVGQKIYTAALERRCLFLSIRDVQLRSVCEIATGRPYDSFDPSALTYEEMMEHVAQDMSAGLNISIQDAREIVARNRQTSNPSQIEGVKTQSNAPVEKAQPSTLPSDYETQLREFNKKNAQEVSD